VSKGNDAAGAGSDTPAHSVADPDPRRLSLTALCCLALLVGAVTGLGAVVFRDLIGLIHNLFFAGQFKVAYDSSIFDPRDPWGPFIILAPVIGGIGVTWIVSNFAPEAKGHGVPEVVDSIYYKLGVIRPVVALVKSIASALAIGSGAAVGREGPIIQIGSALGSTFGQIVRLGAGQRITLVAAGAGAGIAATFNTPIGGVLFASELMLPEISVDTFLPVALATGTATFIGRLFLGTQPAFIIPSGLAAIPDVPASAITLGLYALLGAVTGVAAAGFIRGLHWLEDLFDKIPGRYTRHIVGMTLVGCLMYALYRTAGHYYVEGVGYATIQATLRGQIVSGEFLILLFACKLFATTCSLGSGSSGGVFSPSLFMGATSGGAFASLMAAVAPGAPVSLPAFAMVGMGAMVGGGTGAAMTAVAMIFEMTLDYNIVLPTILAVAMALGTRRLLSPETLYTLKLARRGHFVPKALHANLFLVRSAAEVMETDAAVLDERELWSEFMDAIGQETGLRHVVVTRNGRPVGALRVNAGLRRAVGTAAQGVTLGELAQNDFIVVKETDAMYGVISGMTKQRAGTAVVVGVDAIAGLESVLGVITKDFIADSVAGSVELYAGWDGQQSANRERLPLIRPRLIRGRFAARLHRIGRKVKWRVRSGKPARLP
jgi:chloride channel protein, CIC family